MAKSRGGESFFEKNLVAEPRSTRSPGWSEASPTMRVEPWVRMTILYFIALKGRCLPPGFYSQSPFRKAPSIIPNQLLNACERMMYLEGLRRASSGKSRIGKKPFEF